MHAVTRGGAIGEEDGSKDDTKAASSEKEDSGLARPTIGGAANARHSEALGQAARGQASRPYR